MTCRGFYSGSPAEWVDGLYRPLDTPVRALGTRIGLGGHTDRFQANKGWPLQVAGNSSLGSSPAIPAAASAISLNLTGVLGTDNTYLSVYSCAAPARHLAPYIE